MEKYSQFYIRQDRTSEESVVLIVTDEDPKGVTLTIKDNAPGGSMTSFNLPRRPMIEALEYILKGIKITI